MYFNIIGISDETVFTYILPARLKAGDLEVKRSPSQPHILHRKESDGAYLTQPDFHLTHPLVKTHLRFVS
jgi:hypothetical protein